MALWLLMGLLAAFFYAVQHIASKKFVKKSDPFYFTYVMMLITAVAFIPVVIICWDKFIINRNFLIGIGILSVVAVISRVLYFKSLKMGKISKTVPLLTLTPMFTLIIAMIWLKEYPSKIGIVGILVIVLGAYLLNIEKLYNGNILSPFKELLRNKSSMMMMIVTIIYGLGSVNDKFIIENSNIISRISLYVYPALLLMTVVLLIRDKKDIFKKTKKELQNNWKGISIVTILWLLVVTPQFIGISMTYTAYIIALKRVAAIFAVIFAYFIFKEKKHFKAVMIGTGLMVIGVLLLSLG